MYNPAHFAETDVATLHNAIEQWPLGALIVASHAGFEANHLPFELDRTIGPSGTLRCHVSRANEVWKVGTGAECLVIFQGPSAYISPSLYETKKESGMVVPTYNYVAIHAHGRITVHDDAKWLRGLLGRLTKKFESRRSEPWTMGDAPPEYIEARVKEIVGLEIGITRLEGKWKMSQNRPVADQASVVAALSESKQGDEREVAEIARERSAAPNGRG